MKYLVCLHFPASNNVAEYEALINELCITIELGIRWLNIRGDSQLVIDQVMKESNYHNPKMVAYCQEVRKLEDKFNSLELNHIPRWLNKAADERAKMVFGQEPVLVGIFASDQHKPLISYTESWQASNKPLASSLGAAWPSAPSDPSDPSSGARAKNAMPALGSRAGPHWLQPTPRSWRSTKI
jgi:ribonuclease HI